MRREILDGRSMPGVKGSQKLRVDIPGVDYHRELISCEQACPVHTDARGYVRAIASGQYEEAYLIARGPNPFASICGRFRQSLVRSGAPTTDRSRSSFVFGNLFLHLHSVRVHRWVLRWSTTWGLGVLVTANFSLTLVTGVLLMFYYKPYPEVAYSSIKDIHFVVLGLLLIPYLDREQEGTGEGFGGPGGLPLALSSTAFGLAAVLMFEAFAIHFGWIREWWPKTPQIASTLVNPGTVLTAA
jgi:hypothetical protein